MGLVVWMLCFFFFFQAEDGIRDAQESRGLGDVYKRQDYKGICIADSVPQGAESAVAIDKSQGADAMGVIPHPDSRFVIPRAGAGSLP